MQNAVVRNKHLSFLTKIQFFPSFLPLPLLSKNKRRTAVGGLESIVPNVTNTNCVAFNKQCQLRYTFQANTACQHWASKYSQQIVRQEAMV